MTKNVLRGACAAMLALLAGMLLHYAWQATHRDVPDRPAAPLVEQPPKRWTPPATPDQLNDSPTRGTAPTSTARPPAVKAVAPVADTPRVDSTHDVSVPDYRPPAQPDPVGDYRSHQIMEPHPEDDLESQRQRAYARCVYGQQDNAEQVAYCERWYGPDSGYQG